MFPAPASTGTNVPFSYFGPSPSTVNQSLVGPVQLLNTGQLDSTAGTITIPLYKGSVKSTGKTAWYILTDVSDQGVAQELGLNFSAKLNFVNTRRELATWTRMETSCSIKALSTSRRFVTS